MTLIIKTCFRRYDSPDDGDFSSFIVEVASTDSHTYVYSISYGVYEAVIPESHLVSFNIEAMKLGLKGVSIIASSGTIFYDEVACML